VSVIMKFLPGDKYGEVENRGIHSYSGFYTELI